MINDEFETNPVLQSWAARMSRYNARVEKVTVGPLDIQKLENEYGVAKVEEKFQNALVKRDLLPLKSS